MCNSLEALPLESLGATVAESHGASGSARRSGSWCGPSGSGGRGRRVGRGPGGGGRPCAAPGSRRGAAVPDSGEGQDPRRKNLRGQVAAALAEFLAGEVAGVGRGDARPR